MGRGSSRYGLLAMVSLPAAVAQSSFVPEPEVLNQLLHSEASAPRPLVALVRPGTPGGSSPEMDPILHELMTALAAESSGHAPVFRVRGPMPQLHRLFPGPLLMMANGVPHMGPFEEPDPLIMDMLQDMDREVQESLLPVIHHAQRSDTPHSCVEDLRKHCSRARSQLHCLGEHRSDVSEGCRQAVATSVPFVCSSELTHFCDITSSGVLQCLASKLDQLQGPCRDAVAATREVIAAAHRLCGRPLPPPRLPPKGDEMEKTLDLLLKEVEAAAVASTQHHVPAISVQHHDGWPRLSHAAQVEPSLFSLWPMVFLLVAAVTIYVATAWETLEPVIMKILPVRKAERASPMIGMVEL